MVKRLYLLVCLVCFHVLTWAGVVTGTVKDRETGEELVGATLVVENPTANSKQSQVGTTTDIDGKDFYICISIVFQTYYDSVTSVCVIRL